MNQSKNNPQDEQQESIFNDVEINTKGYDKHIKVARVILFVIAGMQLLGLLTLGDATGNNRTFLIVYSIFLSVVFAGLAIWAKFKPYAALSIALGIYLALYILYGLLEPAYFVTGVILKGAIAIALIIGIRNAKEAEDLKKTLGK